MICKNCSAEYDDKLEACPDCGAEAETMTEEDAEKAEAVGEEKEAPAELAEAEADAEASEADSEETEIKAETEAEADSDTEQTKEDGTAEEHTEEKSEEKFAENKHFEYMASDKTSKPVKPKPQFRRIEMTRAQLIKENKRRALIIVIMCLVASLAVAVTVLNLTTDIFADDGASEKVVAGIGFTAQEEKELEVLLAKSFSVSRNEFSKEGITAEAFLETINPADSGNIYSVLNGVNETPQSEADPADRFADENGSYAYYKLEESKVDNVLSLFGLESLRGENSENYYYCDGFYYFAATEGKATPEFSAEIEKSRRVLDGSYYVEGYFYSEKNGETVKTDNYHFVVEMVKDTETGENVYTVRKVSKKPIFGSDGKLVDGAKNALKQKEVIEGRTDDGKIFSVYTLEFPVVEGESEGYKNLNEFFKNAVSVYELKAKSAQQSYAEFKQNGADESKLPLVENLVATVVFEDEKNLSFKAEISSYNPVSDGGGQSAADGVYKRSVEAYTFDKVTGDFVSKDDALGKNYMLIGEILYRIYSGYEYENLLKKDEESESEIYDETPSDIEGIGAKIYESAWAYTENGIAFFMITEKGYVTEVTIPYDVVEKLK